VSAFTFDLAKEPAQCVLSAAAGSLFIVTVRPIWGGREVVGGAVWGMLPQPPARRARGRSWRGFRGLAAA
jgi:hypothetical protein